MNRTADIQTLAQARAEIARQRELIQMYEENIACACWGADGDGKIYVSGLFNTLRDGLNGDLGRPACEACGGVIARDQQYVTSEDGCDLHAACCDFEGHADSDYDQARAWAHVKALARKGKTVFDIPEVWARAKKKAAAA